MKTSSVLAVVMAATAALSVGARADEIAKGKAIFGHTCANCHSTKIGVNKIGPSLWDVAGRPIASIPDFSYSEKLVSVRAEWKVWDQKRLDEYLTNPRQILHGVKMYFKGLPDRKDREAVISYLATLK